MTDPLDNNNGSSAASQAVPIIETTKEQVQCRMYKNKYPQPDDLVMVRVRQIAEMGAYVSLMEYNNVEGMILLSELSRRRIRSIQKVIRVGRDEVAVVLRVDAEKGYIDLSKRRVSVEDVVKCEDRFRRSREVHSIMRHVAEKCRISSLESLYESVAWPLYDRYGHAYDAFKLTLGEGGVEKVFEGLTISDQVQRELMAVIRKRLTPQATKLRADIEVTCFAYDGIDAVKQALMLGEEQASTALSGEGVEVKIKLVAPPHYVMTATGMDKQVGIAALEKAIATIDQSIKAAKGSLVVKMKPRAVNDADDLELAALMERVERENANVSGDDDDDSDGSEGGSGSDGDE